MSIKNDYYLLLTLIPYEKQVSKLVNEMIYKEYEDFQTSSTEIIDPKNKNIWRECVKAGGFPIIFSLIRKKKYVELVCENASVILTKMLTSPHPDLLSPNFPDIDCVIAENGIETLVDIIDYHFDNIEVCVNACQFLGAIASLTGIECVKADIIPLLIELIDSKCQNEILMKEVSNLIFQITETCYLTDILYESIIPSIITILEYYPYNTVICNAVVSTLNNIINRNALYSQIAVQNNARDALIAVRNNHPIGTVPSLNKVLHSIAKKNFKKHPHDLLVLNDDNHSCDICGAMTGNFMNCNECDYDECMLCFRTVKCLS